VSLRTVAFALALLGVASAFAETLYVTEKLVVVVYPQPDLSGERVTQIRSAEAVEVLAREGENAQIRTADGAEGWVKASYLQPEVPLAAQMATLESENEKLRKAQATATRVDPKPLQKEIDDLRAQLDVANKRVAELQTPARPAADRPDDDAPVETVKPVRNEVLRTTLMVLAVAVIMLLAGFALGYRTLDKRIRAKYGGLKVY
jgi:hypothetical protein